MSHTGSRQAQGEPRQNKTGQSRAGGHMGPPLQGQDLKTTRAAFSRGPFNITLQTFLVYQHFLNRRFRGLAAFACGGYHHEVRAS